jgi:hypothetical protein
MCMRLGQHAPLLPVVVGHSLRHAPPTCARGGRAAREEEGVPESRAIVCRPQGRVRHGAIRAWLHPITRSAWRALRQQRRLEGLLRGSALLGLAPKRHGTIHAYRGEDTLLEVRPLLFALALVLQL